jgi:hypothetical protein
METIVQTSEYEHALETLIGKPLWNVFACETTATAVSLHFGRKIPEAKVYKRPSVSEPDPQVGEAILTVWCSWRVEIGQTQLLCGCGDLHNTGGPMLTGLQKLPGDTVTGVSLNPFLDLSLALQSGRQLTLFCDRNTDELEYGCYYLSTITAHEQVSYAVLDGTIIRERKPLPL